MGKNGYRYYNEDSLLRLQQILFYRELDMRLEDIKKIVIRRDFDVTGALQSHKEALRNQVTRLNKLIKTVDKTMDYLKGEKLMRNRDLFYGFSEEEQEKYALEAGQLYNPETVNTSNRKWKTYSAAEKERIMSEGNAIYADLVAAIPCGVDDPRVQALIGRWHKHIEYFWMPTDDQLVALANGYYDDPRFKANFDKMDPRLARFIGKAVKIYVENRK